MKEIQLTKGYVAVVDDDDYFLLSLHKWYCLIDRQGNPRAMRSFRTDLGLSTMVYMSREILGLKVGDKTKADHKNHNTLDNQRSNLRACTNRENSCNSLPRVGCSSQYKGVCYDNRKKKRNQRWVVDIKHKNQRHRKRFKLEIDAARHYNKMATQFFGEYACLNKIG